MTNRMSRCCFGSSLGVKCGDGHYTIDFALSGEAALCNARRGGSVHEIGLLVSDINMPGMNGLDLLPVVKERRPDLPVFMISAYGDANTIATAMGRGADASRPSRWISRN